MKCVHCTRFIDPEELFVYPQSQVSAHLSCVSLPSVEETDTFLLADKRRATRRVYSTEGR